MRMWHDVHDDRMSAATADCAEAYRRCDAHKRARRVAHEHVEGLSACEPVSVCADPLFSVCVRHAHECMRATCVYAPTR